MKNKRINRTVSVLMASLCLIFTLNAYAQEKKTVTAEDYHLWKSAEKIFSAQVSSDGSWYEYKTGNDTVVNIILKNIKNGLTYRFKTNTTSNQYYKFRNDTKSNFSKDNKWYAIVVNESLNLLNLNTGQNEAFKGYSDFWFVGTGRYILGVENKSQSKRLWLRELNSQDTKTIEDVNDFSLSGDFNKLLFSVKKYGNMEVRSLLLKKGAPVALIAASENDFTKLTWNSTSTTAAFYEYDQKVSRTKMLKLYACSNFGLKPRVDILAAESNRDFPKNHHLNSHQLWISDDGKNVFTYCIRNDFDIKEILNKKKDSIEIWYPNDLTLPTKTGLDIRNYRFWYSWNLEDGKLIQITDSTYTNAALTGDGKKALIYNETTYLPQYKYVNIFKDFYLKDLATGSTKLFLKRMTRVQASPSGKYIAYFRDKNWWVYDIKMGIHTCITKGLGINFEDFGQESTATIPNYGQPGWFDNDSEILIYDEFDVWAISPDGAQKRRITKGRETNRTFRIVEPKNRVKLNRSFGLLSKRYESREGLILQAVNNENLDEGLFLWNRKNGLIKFEEKAIKINILSSLNPDQFFLVEESNFSIPPRLVLYHPSGKKEIVYETNPHQKNYNWGKSELIHYTTPDGKHLKGALFYPAKYELGKQYPMIVYIYEKLSHHLHNYVTPMPGGSSIQMNVLNLANYTTDGYFVFYPDISYDLNKPGFSATKCVISGVEKVIGTGMIDKNNIGLIGHSFGGFETAFIVTQTNIFKTAIPSAGITDLSMFSLQISSYGPNFTRVEEGQFRMNTTFLGEDYRKNSPLHYIHQINTPLLLWTGDKDVNVDPNQTKSFHNALWRLGKQSTMILYAGEDHVLRKPENQIDLVRRIKNWFDYYLKGEKPAEWIAKGFSNSNPAK